MMLTECESLPPLSRNSSKACEHHGPLDYEFTLQDILVVGKQILKDSTTKDVPGCRESLLTLFLYHL